MHALESRGPGIDPCRASGPKWGQQWPKHGFWPRLKNGGKWPTKMEKIARKWFENGSSGHFSYLPGHVSPHFSGEAKIHFSAIFVPISGRRPISGLYQVHGIPRHADIPHRRPTSQDYRRSFCGFSCDFRRNSGAGSGCANFMDTWKNAFFLREKTMSVKFPLLGGGFGGGGCRFYFYGRADFLDFIAFCRCSTGVALHRLKILVSHLAPLPVPGGVAPKFGSEKVSRYTGVSQLQLRVSRYTVQLRLQIKLSRRRFSHH